MNGLALCTGIGGLELGLRIALGDYRTVCYVEREVYCASVIVARMAEQALCEAPVWDDISTFDGRPWCGVVDIITSGDPCQPFSVAGQRQGEADERYLWPHVERIIREVEPEFVFLENVAGAVDVRYEHKAVLEGMGYRVEAGLFSAVEVGAPQIRERLFILAYSNGGGFSIKRSPGLRDGERRNDINRYGCGELAHAIGNRRRQMLTGHEPEEFEDGSKELADTEIKRYLWGDRTWRRRSGSENTGEFVGYAIGEGLQEREVELGNDGKECEAAERTGLFPPGPDGDWGGIPEALEPAIRGVVDGPAFRVERLSCLGNAVVPVVAALAFTTLWGRLNNGQAIEVAPYKSGP